MLDGWAEKVMKENAENDQRIRQAGWKQNRAERKRQYIEVAERNFFRHVVGISDAADRKHHYQKRPPCGRLQRNGRFSRNARKPPVTIAGAERNPRARI